MNGLNVRFKNKRRRRNEWVRKILNWNTMRIYDVMLYRLNCGKVTFIQIKYTWGVSGYKTVVWISLLQRKNKIKNTHKDCGGGRVAESLCRKLRNALIVPFNMEMGLYLSNLVRKDWNEDMRNHLRESMKKKRKEKKRRNLEIWKFYTNSFGFIKNTIFLQY